MKEASRKSNVLMNLAINQLYLQEAEAKKEAELAKQMEAALEGDEDEEQRLIEERRRRRQQILAKHHQDKEFSGMAHLALHPTPILPYRSVSVCFSIARESCMQDIA